MSQKIYTFSVPDSQVATQSYIAKLKLDCARQGRSFSWVVLQALKAYKGGPNE